jgi:hypothetical protein
LRFAVRRPGIPVASPRFHGVPRRDVACRVHVSVAGVSERHAAEEGLALAARRCCVPARGVAPAGERGHGLSEVAERLLLYGLTAFGQPRVLSPRGGELPALCKVTGRGRAPVRVLLDGEVPHEPRVGAVPQQRRPLLDSRFEMAARYANTISRRTDIPPNGEGRERRSGSELQTWLSAPRAS